jgi:hypothetical protein
VRVCGIRTRLLSYAVALCVMVVGLTAVKPDPASAEFSGGVSIRSGQAWKDTRGRPIQAHGGGMLRVGKVYYWYGEYRDPLSHNSTAVTLYSSTNLRSWKYHGQVFGKFSDPSLADSNLERPKIAFNPATGKFVLWAHKEKSTDYSEARAVVAVADHVGGPYTYVRQYRPFANMSRDCTLFVDDDGTAYFVSAANENRDLVFYKLTSDWLDVAEQRTVFPGQSRESPAIFKRDGRYYLISSGTTYWAPNRNVWSSASSVFGPYTAPKSLIHSAGTRTFGTQSTFVMPIRGKYDTTYLYMADKWQPDLLHDSRYLWAPLSFTQDGEIAPLTFSRDWRLDVRAGTAQYPKPPTPAPRNVALGAAVVTDVNSGPTGNAAAMAFDGSLTTRWSASDGSTGHWLTVDLGAVRTLSRSEIAWERSTQANRYRIEVSSDGLNWTTVVDKSAGTPMAEVDVDPVNVSGRFVRFTGLGMLPSEATFYWASILEWRLFDGSGANIAQGRSARASSQEGQTGATVLADGDLSTGWSAGNAAPGHHATVDLGSARKLSGARLIWPEPMWFHEYTVEVSVDGASWRRVAKRSGEVIEHAELLPFAVTARYVRVSVTGYERNGIVSLQEIELFDRRPRLLRMGNRR